MNYKTLKEVGKYMILTGGATFMAGVGITWFTGKLERAESKRNQQLEMDLIKQSRAAAQLDADIEAKRAKAARDTMYASKIESMDKKEFAKFHAEEIAKANADVVANAERTIKDMSAKVVQAELNAKDEIAAIREECLKKIEDANRKRDEAIKKYEAIDMLFTNKDKILAAKRALDESVETEKKERADKEKLMKEIKKMMED